MSTVETLAKASALMTKRAEKATTGDVIRGDHWHHDLTWMSKRFEVIATDEGSIIAENLDRWTAEHIASWGPAVTSEVAKLLQAQVDYWVDGEGPCITPCTHMDCEATNALLPLARAYLGGDA